MTFIKSCGPLPGRASIFLRFYPPLETRVAHGWSSRASACRARSPVNTEQFNKQVVAEAIQDTPSIIHHDALVSRHYASRIFRTGRSTGFSAWRSLPLRFLFVLPPLLHALGPFIPSTSRARTNNRNTLYTGWVIHESSPHRFLSSKASQCSRLWNY